MKLKIMVETEISVVENQEEYCNKDCGGICHATSDAEDGYWCNFCKLFKTRLNAFDVEPKRCDACLLAETSYKRKLK